jgi:hypothetical protein
MRLTPLVLAGSLVVVASAVPAGAAAKPKKPITKTYTATAPAPDPTNTVPGGYDVCAMKVPNSFQLTKFKAPAVGKLKVTATDFLGDWDVLLLDSKGTQIATGESSEIGKPNDPKPEVATAKIKKPGIYSIVVCNWAGGSTAKVTYVFTYA